MSKKKTSDKKTCFVVGPIGEEGSPTRRAADWLLKGIIMPVFATNFSEFDVVRSDIITAPGMIDVQMINHLLDADLVIADMSERNPNAFYEMGIRHMTAKPIVHMFAEGTAIPFDVAPYRAIKFSVDEFEHVERAKRELTAVVAEVLAENYVVENPVTRARGVQKLEENATPAIQILYEEVAFLRGQVAALKAPRRGPAPKFPTTDGAGMVRLIVNTKSRDVANAIAGELAIRSNLPVASLNVNEDGQIEIWAENVDVADQIAARAIDIDGVTGAGLGPESWKLVRNYGN